MGDGNLNRVRGRKPPAHPVARASVRATGALGRLGQTRMGMGLGTGLRRIVGAGTLVLLIALSAPSVAAGARDYDVAGGHYYEQGVSVALGA